MKALSNNNNNLCTERFHKFNNNLNAATVNSNRDPLLNKQTTRTKTS